MEAADEKDNIETRVFDGRKDQHSLMLTCPSLLFISLLVVWPEVRREEILSIHTLGGGSSRRRTRSEILQLQIEIPQKWLDSVLDF